MHKSSTRKCRTTLQSYSVRCSNSMFLLIGYMKMDRQEPASNMVYGSSKQDYIEKLLIFSVKCGNENYNKTRTICTEKGEM